MQQKERPAWSGCGHNLGHFGACVVPYTQEKHQLKLRKPLSEVSNFESADAMFSCKSRQPVLTSTLQPR